MKTTILRNAFPIKNMEEVRWTFAVIKGYIEKAHRQGLRASLTLGVKKPVVVANIGQLLTFREEVIQAVRRLGGTLVRIHFVP